MPCHSLALTEAETKLLLNEISCQGRNETIRRTTAPPRTICTSRESFTQRIHS